MNNFAFSTLCDHKRLTRINSNFVRCLDCGESMISQKSIVGNKNRKDFEKENKSFTRNFDRNFSNTIGENDTLNNQPIFDYYVDRNLVNTIIVNWNIQFDSDPPKYEVFINDDKTYMTYPEIKKIISDTNCVKVDKEHIKSIITNRRK